VGGGEDRGSANRDGVGRTRGAMMEGFVFRCVLALSRREFVRMSMTTLLGSLGHCSQSTPDRALRTRARRKEGMMSCVDDDRSRRWSELDRADGCWS
jgi:hypothetical protein